MDARRIAALAVLNIFLAQAAERPTDLARGAFEAVNRERVRRGLARLAWDDEIAAVARAHSRRMRDLKFFAHEDPERGSMAARLKRARVPYRAAAENLFVEQGYRKPVEQAVKAWLNSPGHRRNLLGRDFTRTGMGVASDGRGKYWFTQIFVGGGKR